MFSISFKTVTDKQGGDGELDSLESLPYARGAEYNAYERQDGDTLSHNPLCHAGTRVALLKDIMAWTEAHDARHVFWLNGFAGTGKSTIARTVARQCAVEQRLGASFFFTRGGGDLASARKFVTTVAVQLAAAVPALKPHIRHAASAVPNVAALAPQDQWARLVLEPLAKLRVDSDGDSEGGGGRWRRWRRPISKPLVLVIDALDECHLESETAAILGLLWLGATEKDCSLRVLLTSRPETPIRYGILAIPSACVDRFVLHEIEPPLVDHDIAIYLEDHLRRIGTAFLRSSDWPGAETVDRLVKQAGGLFIWAATAHRFIYSGKAFATNRLQAVLKGASDDSSPQQSLDRIYLTVLDRAVSEDYQESEKSELHAALYAVLATIAVWAAPLDVISLSHLAAITPDAVDKALHGLHSILDIPDNAHDPIRLHHASFQDFIVDIRRCDDMRFAVDAPLQHKNLAESCLRLMAEHLRQDICDLRGPSVRVSQIDSRVIEQRLPLSLQYACCYWASHIQQSEGRFTDLDGLLAFLHDHLLHWLEALSMLGKLAVAISALKCLEQLSVGDQLQASCRHADCRF